MAAVLGAAADGRLDTVGVPRVSPSAAVCVVLAAPGYPGPPTVGAPITGLAQASAQPGVQIYAAGVARAPGTGSTRTGSTRTEADLVTAGGRVLGVTGEGPSIGQARQSAYRAVDDIDWPGVRYRRDIAAAAEESAT